MVDALAKAIALLGRPARTCVATSLFGNSPRVTNEALVWGQLVLEMTSWPVHLLLTADVHASVEQSARAIGLYTMRVEDPPLTYCAKHCLSVQRDKYETALARSHIRWRLLTQFAAFHALEGRCEMVLSMGVDVLPVRPFGHIRSYFPSPGKDIAAVRAIVQALSCTSLCLFYGPKINKSATSERGHKKNNEFAKMCKNVQKCANMCKNVEKLQKGQ